LTERCYGAKNFSIWHIFLVLAMYDKICRLFSDALEGVPGKVLQPMRAGGLTSAVFIFVWFA